jgi:serine/threonine protein kinase/tetratricopeptide (TPR) repeat protein
MASSRRAVLNLLAAVADGQPVPWDGIQTGDPVADARSVRVLRTIAGVAEVHRTAGAEPVSSWDAPTRPTRPEPQRRWGPLVLLERLGEGAFAEVYRAHDPELDRDVALKLFKTDLLSGPERRTRLLREARTLARVSHEHVVQVYGADEHDGRIGTWMELIQGRNLEDVLGERGRLSAREAAAIGQDLSRALAAVHSAGFTHGDIKAHNVMREDGGRVVLMDFGAGRSRRGIETEAVSGTPLYLAPEVLNGHSPGVDADVYSLGVLLYHLVTATYPVNAASLDGLRRAHAAGARNWLADARPDLDPSFVRVVERASAANPADRFQTAGELESALSQVLGATSVPPPPIRTRRWPAIAAATLAAGLIAAIATAPAVMRRINPPDTDSVAVLPFRSIGNQEDLAYLSEGVSSDLTTLLAKLPDIRVVGGMSVQQFRGTSKSATDVGQALGVKTIVAGVVQLSGDRISVNVELIDCRTSHQIWAQRFDKRTQDLSATQTEIARTIATALRGPLSPRAAHAMERRTMQYRAFELYSLGRYHWNKRTADGLRRSIGYFEEAARLDPSSGRPYAALSDAYILSEVYGMLPAIEAQQRAEAAALQALTLEPDLGEAYAALGAVRGEQFRWAEAGEALQRAIELSPGYPPAQHWYALHLTRLGDFDRGLEHMQKALDLDPLSVTLRTALAFIQYMNRDYTAAIAQYQRALEVENNLSWVYMNLAIAYLGAGQPDNALAQVEKARAAGESETNLNPLRANVYAHAGRAAEARQLLASSVAAAPGFNTEHAAAWVALEEDSTAFEWLERAVALREHDVHYLAVEPRFDRIRSDPRFRALLTRIGLQR